MCPQRRFGIADIAREGDRLGGVLAAAFRAVQRPVNQRAEAEQSRQPRRLGHAPGHLDRLVEELLAERLLALGVHPHRQQPEQPGAQNAVLIREPLQSGLQQVNRGSIDDP